MLTSGFTNAPVTKFLVFYTVAAAFLASITDSQYLLYIQVVPHLWVHRQFWRLLTWQACFANSTEVLFAAMTFYHLRVIERLWGSRKFASFVISTLPYTTLLPPLILALVVRPLTFNHANYLPAGPTPLLFAILAQYHVSVPRTYRYRLAAKAPSAADNNTTTATTASGGRGVLDDVSVTLSSKTLHYLLPLQLALSALPGSAVAAGVGWCVGYAWRNEALPWASGWRVPAWVVGERKAEAGANGGGGGGGAAGRREFEGLRQRMEREHGAAAATGREGGPAQAEGDARRRGTLGGMLAGQFGGEG
ncbi:Uba domain-containing protein ucp14 [Neofusicoccum parvum]|uniref:Uba domain-containing protein ucp14 n=1 Tax=Neofusicoccum parvum TaxID=310453 RepID=A0ACB5SHD2_9PEZI|nr:Uba domain-containing protein ucp14 [Neofusicoccum parvum]GME47704.1 Uba domain-containing protein ucp14 [Neofusicoccum parvum]